MTSSFDIEFKNFITPSIEKFRKSRITRFCKSNNVSIDDVHVHNQIPVWFLVKRFKSENGIKSRLFKSLSEEQKNSWLNYYEQNKQLVILTNEKHKSFHDANLFDIKTGTWRNINPQTTDEKPLSHKREKKVEINEEQTNDEKPLSHKREKKVEINEEHKKRKVRVKKV